MEKSNRRNFYRRRNKVEDDERLRGRVNPRERNTREETSLVLNHYFKSYILIKLFENDKYQSSENLDIIHTDTDEETRPIPIPSGRGWVPV